MNDDEINQGLLAEIPEPAEQYWQNIDAALHASAAPSSDPLTEAPEGNTPPVHRPFDIGVDTASDLGRQTGMNHTMSGIEPLVVPSPRRRLALLPLALAAGLLVLGAWLGSTTLFMPDSEELAVGEATDELDPFADIAGPQQNLDHWHAIYGVWDCAANNGAGDWVPKFDSTIDDWGIHSHDDGIVHIHPFFEESAGKNATWGLFAETMGITVEDDQVTLTDGHLLRAGTECNGKPARIELRRWTWDFQATTQPNAPDRVVTSNFNDERFLNDREVWLLALVPAGDELPLPPQERFDTLNNVTAPVDYADVPTDAGPGYDLPAVPASPSAVPGSGE